MNLRKLLMEIRTSPVRRSLLQKRYEAIRAQCRKEIAMEFQGNPELRPCRPSRFSEMLAKVGT